MSITAIVTAATTIVPLVVKHWPEIIGIVRDLKKLFKKDGPDSTEFQRLLLKHAWAMVREANWRLTEKGVAQLSYSQQEGVVQMICEGVVLMLNKEKQ